MTPLRRSAIASMALFASLAAHAVDANPKAERTERGLTLVVPADHAAMGSVYFALPGRDAQVTFTSDAPVEHIKGTSNRVVGYVVLSSAPGDQSVAVAAGEFHLPVASIDTGIPTRNEHVQEPRWLDAASHPDIVFRITGSRGAARARVGEGFETHTVTLLGDMTIKGETRPLAISATLTLMPESDMTRGRAEGNLMGIRAPFTVKLSDFGVAVGDPALSAGKVSDEIELDVALFLATTSPDERRR